MIEAGPCPVVQVKTTETDGYDAVQIAFDEVVERKISKGELGHLQKAGVGAHRRLVEFRGHSELTVGETVTVEAFEPGEAVKVSGISIGKGFAGTIKRHNFSRGPKTARIAQHPEARLGRRVGHAFARVQGHAHGRSDGRKRRTQIGLVVHDVDPEQNLLLVKGAVPGPRNGIVEIREEKAHTRHHRHQ